MRTHAASFAAVAALSFALSTSSFASPGPLDRHGVPARIVPGRALLKLAGVDARDARSTNDALSAIGARSGVKLELVRALFRGWAQVEIRDAKNDDVMPTEAQTDALIARIAGDKSIAAVSAEHWWKKLAVPNDPGLGQMWHFDAIGAEQAWDVTTGNSSQRIGVVDTGLLRDHEDVGNRAVNGFDFVSDPNASNDGDGRDDDFNDPGDACGNEPSSFHGTHVAGTIGATANNGKGVAGLNWNAGLVIARVLGRCGGSDVDIMEGAAWLAGAHIDGVPDVGADQVSVMNLSLGGGNACSTFDQDYVDFIQQQGAVFVAAAGNDAGAVGSPANCNGVVTVAAFGPTGNVAGYSSFGPEVEIVGPGGDESVDGQQGGVLSSIGPQAQEYAFLEGTSMATPHVTGAISLLQSINPALSRAQIVSALQAGGQACGGCNGVPMLNIPAALNAIGASNAAPPSNDPPATSSPPPSTNAGDDAFEPNDDLAHATPASCGVDDSTLIAAPNNLDVFTLVPPAGAQIAIAIHALVDADLDLYVVDTQGNVLADSISNTGDERITGTAAGDELGIVVLGYVDPQSGVANTGAYELRIDCGGTATSQSSAPSSGFSQGDSNAPVDNAGNADNAKLGAPNGAGRITAPPTTQLPSPTKKHNKPIAYDGGSVDTVGGCASTHTSSISIGAFAIALLFVRRRRH